MCAPLPRHERCIPPRKVASSCRDGMPRSPIRIRQCNTAVRPRLSKGALGRARCRSACGIPWLDSTPLGVKLGAVPEMRKAGRRCGNVLLGHRDDVFQVKHRALGAPTSGQSVGAGALRGCKRRGERCMPDAARSDERDASPRCGGDRRVCQEQARRGTSGATPVGSGSAPGYPAKGERCGAGAVDSWRTPLQRGFT